MGTHPTWGDHVLHYSDRKICRSRMHLEQQQQYYNTGGSSGSSSSGSSTNISATSDGNLLTPGGSGGGSRARRASFANNRTNSITVGSGSGGTGESNSPGV